MAVPIQSARHIRGAGLLAAATVLISCSSATSAATAQQPSLTPSRTPSRGQSAAPSAQASTALLLAESTKAETQIRFFRVTGSFLAAGPTGSSAFSTPAGTPAVRQTFDVRVGTTGFGQTAEQFAEGRVQGPTFSVDVIKLANKLYLRGNAAYYKSLGPKAVAVTGQWLVHTVTEFETGGEPTPQNTFIEGRLENRPDLLLNVITQNASNSTIVGDPPQDLGGTSVIPVHVINHNNLQLSADLYLQANSPHLVTRASWSFNGFPDSETATWSYSIPPFAVTPPANAIDFMSIQTS